MAIDFLAGDAVLCQWRGGHLWFPGVVHSINGASVAIQYSDGSSEIRPANQVRHNDWAAGSRIHALWPGDSKWYDAVIIAIDLLNGALTVRYEDGVVEETTLGRCRSI